MQTISKHILLIIVNSQLANTHVILPIQRRFASGFVNYKKECTRLVALIDKVYQLLAHGRWFSLGTPASSTTKTGRHDIAEILLKVALKHKKNQTKIIKIIYLHISVNLELVKKEQRRENNNKAKHM
jgi:hypothetical protein